MMLNELGDGLTLWLLYVMLQLLLLLLLVNSDCILRFCAVNFRSFNRQWLIPFNSGDGAGLLSFDRFRWRVLLAAKQIACSGVPFRVLILDRGRPAKQS